MNDEQKKGINERLSLMNDERKTPSAFLLFIIHRS